MNKEESIFKELRDIEEDLNYINSGAEKYT